LKKKGIFFPKKGYIFRRKRVYFLTKKGIFFNEKGYIFRRKRVYFYFCIRFAFLFYHLFILFYLFYSFHFSLCKSLAEFTVSRFAFLFYHLFILFYLFYFFHFSLCNSLAEFTVSRFAFLFYHFFILYSISYFFRNYFSKSKTGNFVFYVYSKCCFLDDYNTVFCFSLRPFILFLFLYYSFYLSPSEAS
jgi:hypothetical protein